MASMSKSQTSCCQSGQNEHSHTYRTKADSIKIGVETRKQDGADQQKTMSCLRRQKRAGTALLFHKNAKESLCVSQSSTDSIYPRGKLCVTHFAASDQKVINYLSLNHWSVKGSTGNHKLTLNLTCEHTRTNMSSTHTHVLDQTVCHFISTNLPLLQINTPPVSQAAMERR